jgi:hypothetical protein
MSLAWALNMTLPAMTNAAALSLMDLNTEVLLMRVQAG